MLYLNKKLHQWVWYKTMKVSLFRFETFLNSKIIILNIWQYKVQKIEILFVSTLSWNLSFTDKLQINNNYLLNNIYCRYTQRWTRIGYLGNFMCVEFVKDNRIMDYIHLNIYFIFDLNPEPAFLVPSNCAC